MPRPTTDATVWQGVGAVVSEHNADGSRKLVAAAYMSSLLAHTTSCLEVVPLGKVLYAWRRGNTSFALPVDNNTKSKLGDDTQAGGVGCINTVHPLTAMPAGDWLPP